MPLPDLLPVQPFTRPVRGEITLPGSKSLTNRALLLAALCEQPVAFSGALFSEDTHLMVEALRKLGFEILANESAGTLEVKNQSAAFGSQTTVELFIGLAGTAARFLTALCAAAPRGEYRIDGIPQMRKRPMRGLIDALRALGADIQCEGEEGFFPLVIRAAGLRGGPVTIDASESSQLLSALLMVAPRARSPLEISLSAHVRQPFIEMTVQLMQEFGFPVKSAAHHSSIAVSIGKYTSPGNYAIEPDATAASYFLALPFVTGGSLLLRGLREPGAGLQGDTQFSAVMNRAGLTTTLSESGLTAAFVCGGPRRGLDQNFREFSDTFLTLAALAPLLDRPTRISGIAHSRKQETDRVAGMARELTRLGQHVVETDDALEIHPRPLLSGQTIETYGDHRFAMSFGILGCHDLHRNGQPWLNLTNPGCCAKTFPHFFELLESVRQNSLND